MEHLVFKETDVLEEDLATLVTLVRLVSRVESEVTGEMRTPPEPLPTLVALEGPFPAVHTLVLNKVGPHSEGFPT